MPDSSGGGTDLFAQVPEQIIYDVRLSDRAVRLYAALARRSNKKGECWPRRCLLAADLAWSVDKVDRALKELVDAKCVTKTTQETRSSNLYKLEVRVGGRKSAATSGEKRGSGGRKTAASGGRKSAAQNDSHANDTQEREGPPSSAFDEGSEETGPVDQLWSLFRTKPTVTRDEIRDLLNWLVFDQGHATEDVLAYARDHRPPWPSELKKSLTALKSKLSAGTCAAPQVYDLDEPSIPLVHERADITTGVVR